MMKILAIVFFSSVMLLKTADIRAQYGSMPVFNGVAISRSLPTPGLTYNQINQRLYYNFVNGTDLEYNFRATMKDSTIKMLSSKIYTDTIKHKGYIILVDKKLPKSDPKRKQLIYCDETLDISRMNSSFVVAYGMPTDSCWLFNVVRGKINVYSYIPETENLTNSNFQAFQLGDKGVVMKLDTAKLSPLIKADQKAYKPFLKGDLFKAVYKYNADQSGFR